MNVLRRIAVAIASQRLALVLMGLVLVMAAVFSFLPRGAERSEGDADPYRSVVFLVPCLALGVNLAACTARRIVVRRNGAANSPRLPSGSEILHIGLLVILSGFLASGWGRREILMTLETGTPQTIAGRSVTVLRAADDASGGSALVSVAGRETTIEANHPLFLGSLLCLPAGVFDDTRLILVASDGTELAMERTQENGGMVIGGSLYTYFGEREDGSHRLGRWNGERGAFDEFDARRGDALGDFSIAGARGVEWILLRVVGDPGANLALVGAVMVLVGASFRLFHRKHPAEMKA